MVENAAPYGGDPEPPLSRRYKVGLATLSAVYVSVALLSALLNARAVPSMNADMAAGYFVGMIAGHFACCSAIPLVIAAVIAACIRLGSKSDPAVVLFARVLCWTLLAMIPLQIIAMRLSAAGRFAPR